MTRLRSATETAMAAWQSWSWMLSQFKRRGRQMKPNHKRLVLNVGKATYQGRRSTQDDCYYDSPTLVDKPWLGIVSDGVGGHQGADVASQIGVQGVRDFFKKSTGEACPTPLSLKAGVEYAHRDVVRKAEDLGLAGNIGATVLAFVIDDDTLSWSSAGDSRLFLFRGAVLTQLTPRFAQRADMGQAVKQGPVSAQDADARKSALVNFLGADDLRTDDGAIEIRPGDFIVACTNRIYGTVGDSGLIAACKFGYAAKSAPAEKAVDALFNDFVFRLQDLQQDSATVIIVNVRALNARGVAIQPPSAKSRAFSLGVGVAGMIGLAALAVALKQPLEAFVRGSAPVNKESQAPAAVATQGTQEQALRIAESTGTDNPPPIEPHRTNESWPDQARDQARLDLAKEQLERAKKVGRQKQMGYLQAAIDVFDELKAADHPGVSEEARKALRDARKTTIALAGTASPTEVWWSRTSSASSKRLQAPRAGLEHRQDGPGARARMKREQAAAAEKLPELSVEPEAAAAAQGPDSTESAILPDNMAATATPAELKASAPAEGPNRTAREDRQRSKAGTKAPVEDRSAQFNQTGSFSR